MISVEKCRELLGKYGESISDEKVAEIRNALYELSELALDAYFENREKLEQ